LLTHPARHAFLTNDINFTIRAFGMSDRGRYTMWDFLLWLWSSAEKLGNLAQVATALVAGIALGAAYSQIRSSRTAQREATAHDLNKTLFELEFGHPHFSNPTLASFNWNDLTIDGDRREFQRYETFVHYSLYVCEQLLDLGLGKFWQLAIDGTIQNHKTFLTSDHFLKSGELAFYSPALTARIVELFPELKSKISKVG
jgi:hypothetical protein